MNAVYLHRLALVKKPKLIKLQAVKMRAVLAFQQIINAGANVPFSPAGGDGLAGPVGFFEISALRMRLHVQYARQVLRSHCLLYDLCRDEVFFYLAINHRHKVIVVVCAQGNGFCHLAVDEQQSRPVIAGIAGFEPAFQY